MERLKLYKGCKSKYPNLDATSDTLHQCGDNKLVERDLKSINNLFHVTE